MENKIEKKEEESSSEKIEAVVRGGKKSGVSGSGAKVVTTPTGGQGKTLMAQLLAFALAQNGLKPKLAAADATASSPNGQALSKFGFLAPDVLELGLGPTVDAEKPLAYWDRVLELMMEHSSVIDVGANLIGEILDWARVSRAPDLLNSVANIALVIPVTAQVKSARDAYDLVGLARSQEAQGGLCFSRIVVGLNGRDGEVLENVEIAELVSKMQQKMGVRIATMAKGPDLIAWMESAGKPVEWGLKSTREQIRDEFRLTLMEAHRQHFAFADWVAATVKSFVEAGIIGAK